MSRNSDFFSVLDLYRSAIDSGLDDFFAGKTEQFEDQLSVTGKEALGILAEFSQRPGKRVRGILCAYTYDCFSGQKLSSSGLRAALAIELIQNYLLVIDDVMDKSPMRRGKPAVHSLVRSPGKSDRHFQQMLAINIGLVAQHLAGEILGELDAQLGRSSSKLLHKNILLTCFGQIDDMYSQAGEDKVDEQSILDIYYKKSSSYTFINPLEIATELSGKLSSQARDEINNFGRPAGVAFQLKDDLLGIFGEQEETGKSSSDDLREGKYTLLIHKALMALSPDDAKKLKNILGNQNAKESDYTLARQLIIESGAKFSVEQIVQSLAAEAKKAAETSRLWDNQQKQFLLSLVEYTISRNK